VDTIIRYSPVQFDTKPAEIEERGGWRVIKSYEKEGDGPSLVDLSHVTRWDIQDKEVGNLTPFEDVSIPSLPGQVVFKNGVMINRMNGTQAAIWHLNGATLEKPADMPMVTDTTEATLCLALFGTSVFAITEKLTNLDLGNPSSDTPRLVQGPFAHVPCQIVVFGRNGILWTCSRGYGHDMAHVVLEAGKEFGLTPAGEIRFHNWITS
jgi:hypothetical protein